MARRIVGQDLRGEHDAPGTGLNDVADCSTPTTLYALRVLPSTAFVEAAHGPNVEADFAVGRILLVVPAPVPRVEIHEGQNDRAVP